MKIDKNFIARSISGIVLVAVTVSGVLYSYVTSFILLALIAIAALYELLHNFEKIKDVKPLKLFALASAIVVFVIVFLLQQESYHVRSNVTLSLTSLIIIGRLSMEVFRKSLRPIVNITYEFFALIYILFPFMLLTQIEGRFIVALLVLVWTNDVGAYLFGVTFGRHKLCERLSPKKSWEGYFGGIVSSALFAIAISYVFEQSLIVWLCVGVVVANCAVVGDLFESMIKRSLEIKDSGNVIPGHGGILDRFDALLFAAPIFYVAYIYFLS